jgi:hypothetical protein
MDWIDLAQGRDQWKVIHGNEPSVSIKRWSSCITGGFARTTQLHG